ncbi:hypothetical protein [Gordonibacter sp. 28C]|uniref:hypothetical protein n=1 Tax=Gordonibacter sp. 28C TaxID=2078569 RepID=UPI0011C0810B|nr:hypothetical protein [Gordonibacter sp. 28C]
MSSRTMKIVIGVLAVALVIVGGLAVLKNIGGLGGGQENLELQSGGELSSGKSTGETTADVVTRKDGAAVIDGSN